MLLSKCAICNSKKLKFIKEQEPKGLLTVLGKNPILGKLLIQLKIVLIHLNIISMNEVIDKFLLSGDIFMPKMHLKQPGFTYSACGPFTKNKDRIKKLKETGDLRYIYKNELDKTCFQHDLAFGDFKDLNRKTAADKVLRDKAFDIVKNPKYDGYQLGLVSMVCKFACKIKYF